ncbi:hypothetical protein [Microbulbifer aggregans]|uniref:hypothetical protein n=1 Tax=Microbulbifer aggregans TaxID=1769779 RepID=UPI001CFD4379|nr:hypothetical protein [Microbulbifer aggregans]
MYRSGIVAVAVGATLCVQGCIFVPFENENGNDPFFFNPDDQVRAAEFVEVGNYLPSAAAPPMVQNHCSSAAGSNGMNAPCWFFPIMRMY